MGLKLVSDLCGCSWHSLPSVGLPGPALILYLLFYLIILYFVIFGLYLLEVCYLLARDRNRVDPGREDVGRTWEE